MNQADKLKHLRRAAGLLSIVALPACATVAPAQAQYKVVINHEEQYSIWPADRENARGWKDVGKTGSQKDCMAYIEEVWTDMRPLSLREKMRQRTPPKSQAPYKVVINHEEQYSIWVVEQEMTGRWKETGETCSLEDCMDYIEEVWTDMRPLSLRKKK